MFSNTGMRAQTMFVTAIVENWGRKSKIESRYALGSIKPHFFYFCHFFEKIKDGRHKPFQTRG